MAEIDIEVKQGILGTYHNYPYKSPQVFGEFIDNAIQSFEDNKNILTADPNYILKVAINIEWATSADNIVRAKTITIEDNSAGMTAEKFAEAFKSADPSTIRIGMNEFGMGMKVAACWFGKKWRVESKSLAEPETRILEIDVEKVSAENLKKLTSHETIDPSRKHGTKIVINDMWPQTQIKKDNEDYLIKGIASIYRYFIRRGEIEISVNDHILTFDKYEVLKATPYTDSNAPEIEWSKNVTLNLGRYGVSGFVALLKDMDEEKRGVVIMRNHRVVMGFDPSDRTIGKAFMGQVGSFKYRRVFGELEVTGFEAAFGKNQVIDLDQLEALMKAVAGKLIINGVNLLTQGGKYKKKSNASPTPTPSPSPQPNPHPQPTPAPTPAPQPNPTPAPSPVPTPPTPSSVALPAEGKFKFGGIDYKIKIEEGTESNELFWNDHSQINENILRCKVNTNHPFFAAYGEPTKQLVALIKALSIAKFKANKDHGGNVNAMMNEFNQVINNQSTQE